MRRAKHFNCHLMRHLACADRSAMLPLSPRRWNPRHFFFALVNTEQCELKFGQRSVLILTANMHTSIISEASKRHGTRRRRQCPVPGPSWHPTKTTPKSSVPGSARNATRASGCTGTRQAPTQFASKVLWQTKETICCRAHPR